MPDTSTTPISRLALSAEEAAAAHGVSVRTWWSWDRKGLVPEPDLRIGKVVRWKVTTLSDWLAAGAPDREQLAALQQASSYGQRRRGVG